MFSIILWVGIGIIIPVAIGAAIGTSRFSTRLKKLEDMYEFSLTSLRQRVLDLEKGSQKRDSKYLEKNVSEHTKSVDEKMLITEADPYKQLKDTSLENQGNTETPVVQKPITESDKISTVDEWKAKEEDNDWIPSSSSIALFSYIKRFFTEGNPVVRVGIVVLFFGVAFLVKYATERSLFPIELRLACIAIGGLAMLTVGWKKRFREGSYGLVLQGGGIGVLYLTVFGAVKLYGLLPEGLAFVLMIVLVSFSGILAVMQDARPLAIFGVVGGFLAPILISTSSISHVALFSYYALLNVGILGVALFKSWRVLNFIGFVFTFVIASIWGYYYYRPEYYQTIEPFLILFFFFYFAIAILYAYRQPLKLKGYVDASLVFGVPLVGFALQQSLVSEFEHGLTISAIVLSAVYIISAAILRWFSQSDMKLLSESFLALGVIFGSLAIPLALDGRWTAVVWSLEGAAMAWIGIRQYRWLVRDFGILLQLGSGISFFMAINDSTSSIPVLNGFYLGCFVISIGGLFSAWYLDRHEAVLTSWEEKLSTLMLVWGLCWWFGAGIHEIDLHFSLPELFNIQLLFIAASCLFFNWLESRCQWSMLRLPLLGLLPVISLVIFFSFFNHMYTHPFVGWGSAIWLFTFAVHYHLLRRYEKTWPLQIIQYWHSIGLWLLVFLVSWEFAWHVERLIPASNLWQFIAWAAVPCLTTMGILKWGTRISWPLKRFDTEYFVIGLSPIVVYLYIWGLIACLKSGNTSVISYLPILNPLDLMQILVLMTLSYWVVWLRSAQKTNIIFQRDDYTKVLLGLGGFAWLNAALARAVHFWGGVPYTINSLSDSVLFQTSVTVLWALIAFVLMIFASQKINRGIWRVGAGLLALVVIKLFLIDLDGSGTIARIVSFIAVGGLMLVIGYFSPLPPLSKKEIGDDRLRT